MNFQSDIEDAKRHASTISCYYCGKECGNGGALGSHLRTHRDNRTLMALNIYGLYHSIKFNSHPPTSIPNNKHNSAGASNQTPIIRVSHPIDFCSMWHSNEANHASMSRSPGSNLGVAHNSLTSRTFALAGASTAMPSASFALSNSVVTAGLPTVPSLHLGSNGVFQYNTDQFRFSRDGLPPTSGDALKNNQGYNIGPPLSSAGRYGQFERSLSMGEGSKRPYLANNLVNFGMMNAFKKLKLAANEHVERVNPQIKELPLLKILEDSLSPSETCVGAKDEGPADLDLSLHL